MAYWPIVVQAENQSHEPDEARRSCAIGRNVWHNLQRILAQFEETGGIQQALSNDYLKAEGLVSLRDGCKLHHSR
jgi:hypothetical protein